MPGRRSVLAVIATSLAGCWSDRAPSSRRTATRDRRNARTATRSPTPTREPPTPRSEPLSVDGSVRWAAPHYDAANTSRVPTNGPRERPELLWEAWLDGESLAARVHGERLLAFGRRTVWTLDRRDGRVLGSTALDADLASRPTLVGDGFVAGVRSDGDVGVTRADGAGGRVWETDLVAERVFGPTVAHGRAYVATDGALVALDLDTGDELWRHVAEGGNPWTTRPGAGDGVVYGTGAQESLYEVDAATGERNWRYSTGTYAAPASAPTVGQHLVFTGAGNSVAVGRELGARAWSAGGGAVGSHALAGNRVVAATREGRVLSLSRRLGVVEWAADGAAGRPLVTDSSVFVRGPPDRTGDDRLVALDRADGTVRWRRDLGASGWAVVVDGYVYVNRGDGVVQCFG